MLELRPGFSVAHYWNEPDIWWDWFAPKLAEELGPLWPLVLIATVGGGVYALWKGREPILRALGGVAVLTAFAYVFTPLTAGGEEGEPIAFEWNIRYLAPAVAIGLAILPLLPAFRVHSARPVGLALRPRRRRALHHAHDRPVVARHPHEGSDRDRRPRPLSLRRRRSGRRGADTSGPRAPRGRTIAVVAAVGLAAVAAGFAVQRHYLERRYEDLSPQLRLAEAVRWANTVTDERIAISGVRGVFNQYAFSGYDLSNHVQWLGHRGRARCVRADPRLRDLALRGERRRVHVRGDALRPLPAARAHRHQGGPLDA